MNKYSSPRKRILTAKEGSIFWIKGERFVVKIQGERIFLTSEDRRKNSNYFWIHLRNKETGIAVMSREIMYDLLINNTYEIS